MRKTLSNIIYEQVTFINNVYNILISDDFDLIRIAASHRALLKMGVTMNEKRKREFINLVNKYQHIDGGFTELRETLIVMEVLYEYGENIDEILQWMFSLIDNSGGIRAHPRERTRMPDTALTFALLHKLNISNIYRQEMVNYISTVWSEELYKQGGLTYKAGRFLSAYSCFEQKEREANIQLYKDTIAFLEKNQRDDGGFSPNKSDGLMSMPLYSSIVYKGLKDSLVVEGQKDTEIILDKLFNYMCESSQIGKGWAEHERDYTTSSIIYNLIEGGKVRE